MHLLNPVAPDSSAWRPFLVAVGLDACLSVPYTQVAGQLAHGTWYRRQLSHSGGCAEFINGLH